MERKSSENSGRHGTDAAPPPAGKAVEMAKRVKKALSTANIDPVALKEDSYLGKEKLSTYLAGPKRKKRPRRDD